MAANGYPSDLSDEQWTILEPLIPPPKRGGRPRTADLRRVCDTIFYVLRSGCQWAMIPKDLAKRSTAAEYFLAWRDDGTWQKMLDALRRQARVAAGHDPEPRKAAIDTPTVKGSEAGGPRGYDGGQKINGRKRHLIVDSLGFLIVVLVTAANVDDGTHAPAALARLTATQASRLDEIRGDGKYNNRTLQRWIVDEKVKYKMTVVERSPGAKGLVLLPFRWVVERTNAWTGKSRRCAKDYERTCESSEAMIQAGAIHLLLNRLAPKPSRAPNPFRYTRKPMQKSS